MYWPFNKLNSNAIILLIFKTTQTSCNICFLCLLNVVFGSNFSIFLYTRDLWVWSLCYFPDTYYKLKVFFTNTNITKRYYLYMYCKLPTSYNLLQYRNIFGSHNALQSDQTNDICFNKTKIGSFKLRFDYVIYRFKFLILVNFNTCEAASKNA